MFMDFFPEQTTQPASCNVRFANVHFPSTVVTRRPRVPLLSSRWVHNGYGARDDDGAVCACSLLEYMILEGSESKLRFSYDRPTRKDMSRHVMACAQHPSRIYHRRPTSPLPRVGCDSSTTAFQYHLSASGSEDEFTTVRITNQNANHITKREITQIPVHEDHPIIFSAKASQSYMYLNDSQGSWDLDMTPKKPVEQHIAEDVLGREQSAVISSHTVSSRKPDAERRNLGAIDHEGGFTRPRMNPSHTQTSLSVLRTYTQDKKTFAVFLNCFSSIFAREPPAS